MQIPATYGRWPRAASWHLISPCSRRRQLKLSREKRLWEKLNVATKAARSHKSMKAGVHPWLHKTVKNPAAYGEVLGLADDEAACEKWLQNVGV
jgi:hypothetical protein